VTRVLYRISRNACPAADRPWLDALFAELEAVESTPARLLWLLGAVGLVASRHIGRLDARLVFASALCLAVSLLSGAIWFSGSEVFALDDDLYMAAAAFFASGLVGLSVLQLRHPMPETWP
jgi:amino acid transporter